MQQDYHVFVYYCISYTALVGTTIYIYIYIYIYIFNVGDAIRIQFFITNTSYTQNLTIQYCHRTEKSFYFVPAEMFHAANAAVGGRGPRFKNREAPPTEYCLHHVLRSTLRRFYNVRVMFCRVELTVRPTDSVPRCACWCLHTCKSVTRKRPHNNAIVDKFVAIPAKSCRQQ